MQRLHASSSFHYAVALVILSAFFVTILEAQLLPEHGSRAHEVLWATDAVITALFFCELLVNLIAHSDNGFRPFYSSVPNWFDVGIVTVSLVRWVAVESDAECFSAQLAGPLSDGFVVEQPGAVGVGRPHSQHPDAAPRAPGPRHPPLHVRRSSSFPFYSTGGRDTHVNGRS